ncbi:MAG: Na(+)-translocating NADH-quinone reductase subunit A [Candidatus Puniceispirillales bacterium]|jgi:Na+-transporting NADH:ubiquinone oxidoreductase subunit A|tara:strand:- start:9115 stop:10458 length:1344 start_codon:yes stop_codon:yes gene_type:complete
MKNFNLKRGLDIPILGIPEQKIYDGNNPETLAVLGPDYNGLKPKMLVSVGDKVVRGTPLFCHKDNPDVLYVSPCKGHVESINRGEKRALLSVVISVDSLTHKGMNIVKLNSQIDDNTEFVRKCLYESGLWTSFLTRPYSKVPQAGSVPTSIFITAMDTEPLCPDADLIINQDLKAFEEGVKKISTLTEGEVFICKKNDSNINLKNFKTYNFDGPHPAGLAGTHIHFLDPPNGNKMVWSVSYQDVIAIGKLFLSGHIDIEKTISLAGPLAKNPRLVKTVMGASLFDLLKGEFINNTACRVISGSVLSGFHADGHLSFLGRYSRQVTLIEEDKEKLLLGWINPQPNKFSVMPVLASAFGFFKLFNLTSNLNGGRRAMVPTGVFETLMPQDYLPTQLLRSLIVMDTDVAQSLGTLELDEEDLALCTFACPAKYEYGSALRDSLVKIEKEG